MKKIGDRPARKRGGVASKRGISSEQVCVLVAMDRNKEVLTKVAGNGQITHKQVEAVINPRLGEVTTLCTNSAACFKKYAKVQGIEHEFINAKKKEYVKKGIYHVQNVNSYHKRLRDWLRPFHGVATKYLNNYLFWHRFVDVNRKVSKHILKMIMAQEAYKVPVQLRAIQFRPCLLAA